MAKYKIETRNIESKNLFAGEFPILTESGIAGENLKQYTPITIDGSKKIIAITDEAKEQVIGITAETAESEETVVYYITGEFFADAINLPNDVKVEDIKDDLRKLSIFLK